MIEDSKQLGTYIAPRDRFKIAVPALWCLRETGENLELASPSRKTAVIVTTFHKRDTAPETDTRKHLERFLKGAPVKGEARVVINSKWQSSAQYVDSTDAAWDVMFLANGDILLLATCNSNSDAEPDEKHRGVQVLKSIQL
jgi:hypothetical protein